MVPEEADGQTTPHLRSGLYLLPTTPDDGPPTFCLVYWPEQTTWDDNADESVRRNCVTFVRYLTQLTAEVRVLMSQEDAAAFAWNDQGDRGPLEAPIDDQTFEEEDTDRFFKFEVAKTSEEEEDVQIGDGFTVSKKKLLVIVLMLILIHSAKEQEHRQGR